MVSTPLLSKSSLPYYYLALEGICVGNKRFNASKSSTSTPLASNFWRSFKGNIVIDSGSMLTYLPTKLYNQMETAMKEVVRLEVIKDPTEVLRLCYKIQLGSVYQFPVITFHFKGTDVKLETLNTFVRVNEYILCHLRMFLS